MSIVEKNELYIKTCLKDKTNYTKLEDLTKGILEGRNQSFQKLRTKNELKKAKVQDYYDTVIPEGMSTSEYKVGFIHITDLDNHVQINVRKNRKLKIEKGRYFTLIVGLTSKKKSRRTKRFKLRSIEKQPLSKVGLE